MEEGEEEEEGNNQSSSTYLACSCFSGGKR